LGGRMHETPSGPIGPSAFWKDLPTNRETPERVSGYCFEMAARGGLALSE
jgi:hypothetical protein